MQEVSPKEMIFNQSFETKISNKSPANKISPKTSKNKKTINIKEMMDEYIKKQTK